MRTQRGLQPASKGGKCQCGSWEAWGNFSLDEIQIWIWFEKIGNFSVEKFKSEEEKVEPATPSTESLAQSLPRQFEGNCWTNWNKNCLLKLSIFSCPSSSIPTLVTHSLTHWLTVLNSASEFWPNHTKPTWTTYATYFPDPPEVPDHLVWSGHTHPPDLPTHLSYPPTWFARRSI